MDNEPHSVKLFCWVLDVSKRSFPVNIDDSQTVGDLKEKVLAKKSTTYATIEVDQVEIRKVSIPTTPPLTNDVVKQKFLEADPLDETGPLSDVFRVNPATATLHIVIQGPHIVPPGPQSHQLLHLNCLIHGDDSNRVFPVKIASTESIGTLKKAIKDEKKVALEHVDADALNLWNVSIAAGDGFEENVGKFELSYDKILDPMTILNKIYPVPPEGGSLHVIVHCEPASQSRTTHEKCVGGERRDLGRDQISTLEQRRDNVITGVMKALSPSDSAKSSAYTKSQIAYSIHDGRYKAGSPRTSVAPPVELFHPAFGHFLDDIKRQDDVPKEITRKTTAYMKAASAVYPNERKRRETMDDLLIDVLDVNIQTVENIDKTCPDGVIEFRESIIGLVALAFCEWKNENGEGGCDASTQVGLSVARSLAQLKYTKVRNATCCPAFLIAIAGPWIVVLGGVITDMFIVQRLTDYAWVGLDSALNESRISRVARMFYALKMGIERLRGYYQALKSIDGPRPSTRFFPSITAYHDGHKIVPFKYVGYLENDPSCTALRARTCTNPSQEIVVKFSERYGERAHRLLTEKELAPKLLYCGQPGHDIRETLPSYNGLKMVVMEYVRGRSLASVKGKMTATLKEQVGQMVREALEALHKNGLVFGDLRPPNVMISETGEVKLIDFDWAGDDGQVKYPSLISPDVKWPDGVQALDIIEREHDHDMLSRLCD